MYSDFHIYAEALTVKFRFRLIRILITPVGRMYTLTVLIQDTLTCEQEYSGWGSNHWSPLLCFLEKLCELMTDCSHLPQDCAAMCVRGCLLPLNISSMKQSSQYQCSLTLILYLCHSTPAHSLSLLNHQTQTRANFFMSLFCIWVSVSVTDCGAVWLFWLFPCSLHRH